MSVLALDIGGTKIAAARVNRRGVLTDRTSVPTPAAVGAPAIIAACHQLCEEIFPTAAPRAIGIGTAGVVDRDGRRIIAATSAIHNWAGTDLAGELEAVTGVPVIIENDVNAHLRGEMWQGAATSGDTIAMVAVGTGIGGALAIDRAIRVGPRGLGGDIGHVPITISTALRCPCGAPHPHLETIASGPAMVAWYHERGGSTAITSGTDLFAAADAGDQLAAEVITAAAEALGGVLAGVANLIDPDRIVVGGGVAGAGSRWWTPLTKTFRAGLLPALADLQLSAAALGADAALVGAAHLAYEGITS